MASTAPLAEVDTEANAGPAPPQARIAVEHLAEIGEWMTSVIASLDAPAARAQVEQVTAGPKNLAMLHGHLRAYPDAFTSGESDCPLVVVRLLAALTDAGHAVTPPRCIRCRRSGLTLNCRITGGRLCGTCANRHRAQPCYRCGLIATVHARQDGHPLCLRCFFADPATGTRCSQCACVGRVAQRTPTGEPLCPRCYQPPTRQCIHCGHTKLVSRRSDAGPICYNCCRRPPRPCDHCGATAKIATRRQAREALCRSCLRKRERPCHLCSRFGSWRASRRHHGQWTCPDCYSQSVVLPAVRECTLCARTRRITVTWPLGGVCGTCYRRIRSHPDPCSGCGDTEVLIGRDSTGTGLCAHCCGAPEYDYHCTRCGTSGYFHTVGRCLHCQAVDRVHELLADPEGAIAAPMAPFVKALRQADSPDAVLQWLRPGQPAVAILNQLTATDEPVTHELLDTFNQTLALHRLRQTLVHTGVLPERADYLERLVPWLDNLLDEHPPARAHLIRTYTHWTLLRRARHRSRTRRFTPGSGNWLRTRVLATVNFLTWLDSQHLTLTTVTQAKIDQWLTATPTDATYAAREFLHWARQHHLTSDVAIPKRSHHASLPPITEDDRWTQLRRCLHEHTLPTEVRAAGALVLLFGLPVSKITTLRHDDIHTDQGHSWLQMTHHRLPIPPAVAALLHTQRLHGIGAAMLDRNAPDGTPWLFPGGLPGRPARDALYRALRTHLPVHLRRARSAALANLAAELPAAVLAQLLDLNINTAIAWANYAQHDWTAYLAARTADGIRQGSNTCSF